MMIIGHATAFSVLLAMSLAGDSAQQISPADRTLVMKRMGPDMSDLDPEKDLDITKTDLNRDGHPDYIVVVQSSLYCGSGGCSTFVYLSGEGDKYRDALADLLTGGVTVGTGSTQGVRDLMVTGRSGIQRWAWDGKAYHPAGAPTP